MEPVPKRWAISMSLANPVMRERRMATETRAPSRPIVARVSWRLSSRGAEGVTKDKFSGNGEAGRSDEEGGTPYGLPGEVGRMHREEKMIVVEPVLETEVS